MLGRERQWRMQHVAFGELYHMSVYARQWLAR